MVATKPAVNAVIEVVPATVERWSDLATLLADHGDGDERGCWCQPWRGKDEVARDLNESRPETLRRQLATFDVPPGFLAYVDGEIAGWCGVALRAQSPRLASSRTIPAIDDQAVWVIACFRIRVGYRRQGVATALLTGVVEAAQAAGAPGVEAYPIDPQGRRVDVGFAYVGLLPMFERAGFEQVGVTGAQSAGRPRVIVRRMFEPSTQG
jgi:GNAT superfamily N-acetyltransferase